MPWHQSLSNPRKVYNERHEQVCICETQEQAALIVEAVRHYSNFASGGPAPTGNSFLVGEFSEQQTAPRFRELKTEEPEASDFDFSIV